MNKKIGIAMAALMMAALVAPVVMAADYTATVLAGQNTAVAVGEGGVAFGSILQGNSNTLTTSLVLTNSGGVAAAVSAAFTTLVSPTYGLVDTATTPTLVIPASNFELGTTGNLVGLLDAGTSQALGTSNNVLAATSVNYDARLTVPSTQAAGAYSGTVELAFANA